VSFVASVVSDVLGHRTDTEILPTFHASPAFSVRHFPRSAVLSSANEASSDVTGIPNQPTVATPASPGAPPVWSAWSCVSTTVRSVRTRFLPRAALMLLESAPV
jgi:hypothetical protein